MSYSFPIKGLFLLFYFPLEFLHAGPDALQISKLHLLLQFVQSALHLCNLPGKGLAVGIITADLLGKSRLFAPGKGRASNIVQKQNYE